LDREEFYRLKKVANKKQRDTAAADAEMKAKKEASAAADQENVEPEGESGPSDILATGEDDDVIF
jgi:V-type H+-transporting ATPase subunit D